MSIKGFIASLLQDILVLYMITQGKKVPFKHAFYCSCPTQLFMFPSIWGTEEMDSEPRGSSLFQEGANPEKV